MISPKVCTGIEESREEAGSVDNRSDVAAFRPIAKRAGIRQIALRRLPAVFFADDVIDFAAEEGVFLVDQAVFTKEFRAGCDEPAQGWTNVAAHQPDGHGPELWPSASDALTGDTDLVLRTLLKTNRSFSRDGSNRRLELSLLLTVGRRSVCWALFQQQ
jgi:hypothetical protein